MTEEFETSPARQPTVSKSAEHAPIRSVEVRADWRARKWARKRMATRCDEDGFPEVAEAYRRGDRDEFLRDDIEAYRAGAADAVDGVAELEARVAELEAALRPSMWVGPTGIEFSFSAPGRPLSSNPVDDSGWADTEVKDPDQ